MGASPSDNARLVAHAPGLLAAIDSSGMFAELSPSWETLLGWPADALRDASYLKLVHADELEEARVELAAVPASHAPVGNYDRRLRRSDGTYRWVHWQSRWDEDRKLIVTAVDITDRKAREHEALHDPMTGLASRALGLDRLNAALDRLRRRGGAVMVLIVDVDGLTAINDLQGYEEGDALLRAVGARVTDRVRKSDTVARLGGDRFMVVADDVQAEHPGSVETVIERVSLSFSRPFRTRHSLTPLSASIGVAVARDGGVVDADRLIRDADTAVARAKGQGPGNVEVFDTALADEVRDRIELASDMRGALQRGELQVVFQPLVSMTSGAMIGCEALLRWQHPTRGLLLPETFLRIAEDDGLIVPVGAWVLEQACSQLAAWRSEGLELTMSVNVSSRQLEQRDFAAIVERVLQITGVPPSAVCLEITETSIMRRPERVSEALSSLRRVGVKIALDDFGMGYSSLTHLKSLPVDIVKVDRSFIAQVCDSDQDLAVVEGLLTIARRMGLTVVAEGVENADQDQMLRELGCPIVQGYLYGHPAAPDDVSFKGATTKE